VYNHAPMDVVAFFVIFVLLRVLCPLLGFA
jgi:hypothetical protein